MALILLVDDDELERSNYELRLDTAGYEVVSVCGGVEALDKIAKVSIIDLILSDYQMPGMDGLELLKKVRQIPKMRETPFILHSGSYDQQLLRSCENAGVSFFHKTQVDALLEEISNVLYP